MKTTILVALLITIAGQFMADELKAWFGWLHGFMRRAAVAKLPAKCRERYDEEWESGQEEIPGEIFKLIYSIGLLRAAVGIRKAAVKSAEKSERLTGSPVDSWRYEYVKRAIDILFTLIMLAVFAIPGLLIAAMILLTSKGPVFYREERIGRDGRRFLIWKFRSMHRNAARRASVADFNPNGTVLQWRMRKHLKDSRITAIGSILRRWSLDELPQLFTVLRGEMSLIGPRPVIEAETAFYGSLLPFYLAATPGLSGLWQVSGRSNIDYGVRAKLDALYVRSWSLGADFRILLRTISTVLVRRGER